MSIRMRNLRRKGMSVAESISEILLKEQNMVRIFRSTSGQA